jgi:DNA-binding NarL/FixJ family response regulator
VRAAESLRETIGASPSPVELRVYGPYIEVAREEVGEAAWEEAWAEGKAMTAEEAVQYAAAEGRRVRPRRSARPKEAPAGNRPDDVLTGRQLEVALLVARGLTNRQIASELTIFENTVANHVAGICRKLDVASRSRIAVWAAEREPPKG